MNTQFDICLSKQKVKSFPKEDLVDKFMDAQERISKQSQELKEKDQKIKELKEDLENIKKDNEDKTLQQINSATNQPTSKQPEWDKDGNPKKKGSKGKKNGGRRKGSGNKKKKEVIPDEKNSTPLNSCPECGEDLQEKPVHESPSRMIEDIPEAPQPVVSEETTEKKWCPRCKKVVSSKSEKALSGSDYGLNTMILCAYFWVITAISLPNISRYLSNFFEMCLSTSGISRMMIRLSEIHLPVYNEILEDVKSRSCLWADETGWRIRGQTHWLWAFANKESAYYWIDRSRGSDVVNLLLGNIFSGVLITDAWGAYNRIKSERQTCMAHIFRKVRKMIDHHPQYRSLLTFYTKLRRILKDAKSLQDNRESLGEIVFQRRLQRLKNRLSKLLQWKNPNPMLKEVINKVKRQEKYILTFVEHKEATSHNNYAEYTIKKGVLKRKISGGSMSMEGAKAYSVLLSIAQTCHLRGLSFHGYLKASTLEYIRAGKPMLLSQYGLSVQSYKKAS